LPQHQRTLSVFSRNGYRDLMNARLINEWEGIKTGKYPQFGCRL